MGGELREQYVVKAAANRAACLENLALAFMKETGLKASEIELIEECRGTQMVWYFRRRTASETPGHEAKPATGG